MKVGGSVMYRRRDLREWLDMLARHFSLYNDKLEVSVTEGLAERVKRARERAYDKCQNL